MATVMFLFGMIFYKSDGKAVRFLSGYNMKTEEKRKKYYEEKRMCRAYGKRMTFMSLPFIGGAAIDIFFNGTGFLIAWVLWIFLFILLIMNRYKREN